MINSIILTHRALNLNKFYSTAKQVRCFIHTVYAYLQRCINLHHQRKALLQLSEQQLKDIGISRAQAEEEAKKGFWH